AVAGQGLVDGVVHDLVDQVVQATLAGGADIHARPLADRLQPFEDLDLAAVVLVVGGGIPAGDDILCHCISPSSFVPFLGGGMPFSGPSPFGPGRVQLLLLQVYFIANAWFFQAKSPVRLTLWPPRGRAGAARRGGAERRWTARTDRPYPPGCRPGRSSGAARPTGGPQPSVSGPNPVR